MAFWFFSLHPQASCLSPVIPPIIKVPEYWYLSASRRLQLGPLGKYQAYLKTVEDLPGTLTPGNTVILPPLVQITTVGRDYLCIKSPLKIKSLANGTVRGKGFWP